MKTNTPIPPQAVLSEGSQPEQDLRALNW